MTRSASGRRSRLLSWIGSVRLRSAVVSTLIVGVAFALSAVGVVTLLRDSLYKNVANTAQVEAVDISAFIATRGQLPAHLPSAANLVEQIVANNGKVLASTRNIASQPAMVGLMPSPDTQATRTGVVLHLTHVANLDVEADHRFVVAAVGFHSHGRSGAALAGASLDAADHAVNLVALALGIALPVLAGLVGLLVWFLTGWALRPVEDIRSEVAELSAMDLHRRVPEPMVQDEIGRLARTMNGLLGRLETSNDRQRRLVADVSHELRNPLAALRAQLEVAVAHPGSSTPVLLTGSITEVNRMTQLVEDLLTLARLDEGMLSIRPVDVDLDELALTHAERLRGHGKVAVSVEGVSAARLRGDEAQLGRVVANLADNAERYASGRVHFAVAHGGDSFDLIITDDGPGVPSEERERIFERFARLDSARTHTESGAGLGLAIVKEIVAAHGGTVWVEDAAPGARFIVRLPSGADGVSEAAAHSA